jgi:hypothetical protein
MTRFKPHRGETTVVATTVGRVPQQTSVEANRRISYTTLQNIARCGTSREAIDRRLRELDAEWDIERCLEANAATAMIVGTCLTALGGRKFLVLPLAVGGFLLQHAIQGWCPPMPVFRRFGVRTQREIDEERTALKALRGDFAQAESPSAAYAAARS